MSKRKLIKVVIVVVVFLVLALVLGYFVAYPRYEIFSGNKKCTSEQAQSLLKAIRAPKADTAKIKADYKDYVESINSIDNINCYYVSAVYYDSFGDVTTAIADYKKVLDVGSGSTWISSKLTTANRQDVEKELKSAERSVNQYKNEGYYLPQFPTGDGANAN